MPNIGYWLDRKYSNMEQRAANEAQDVISNTGLRAAQAGLQGAQAAEAGARTGVYGQQAEAGRLANLQGQLTEQTALPAARSYLQGAIQENPAAGFGILTGRPDWAAEAAMRKPAISSNPAIGELGSITKRPSVYNKGTAKVMKKGETRVTDETGNGHPRVDTVPAMLAEGEAVLNAGAAERMGRDEIKSLNKQGLRDMKMGGVEPTMKKGGRIGPFTGVEHGYRSGTNFARTSPNNDAEYHPTEYSEPRDPEHDAEHMAQPLSSGGQGYGLRCGTAKVMKYADGTSDAGGHGSPDSPGAVNMAGTPGGRGRNMGAKFVGVRGYANGIDRVPSESETELANFARQRDRNNIDEAMPAGTPVANEAAGQQGAVTPSRDSARLRQAFGLTAQGFAMGTEDVQAMQMRQDPDTVYAAEGDDFISKAKSLGARAVEGARSMMPGRAIDLGMVGEAAPSAAQATTSAAEQAVKQGATQAAESGGRGLSYQAGQAVGKAGSALRGAGITAVPVIGGALTAGQAMGEMNSADGFFNDPNVPAHEKYQQTLRTFGRAALPYFVGAIGSGIAPVAGTIGGAALGGLAASKIDAEGEALKEWRAKNPAAAKSLATAVEQPAAQPAATQAESVKFTSAADTKPARMTDAEFHQAGLRGLATMGSMLGSPGSQAVMKDLTDRESEASRLALSRATKAGDDVTKWSEGLGKGMFTRVNEKGVREMDPATESDFRRYALDRLSEKGVNVAGLTPKQKAAAERDMLDEFNNMRVLQEAAATHGQSLPGKMFGGVDPRGRVTPVGRIDDLSLRGAFTQPYSILQGMNPAGTRGVKVRDAAGNEFVMPEADYTRSQSTGLREPLRQQAVKDLPLVRQ